MDTPHFVDQEQRLKEEIMDDGKPSAIGKGPGRPWLAASTPDAATIERVTRRDLASLLGGAAGFAALSSACAGGPGRPSQSTASGLTASSGNPTPDWLNARDYGALGDGVTDDTAALQQWLQAVASAASANAGQGVVAYLPSGCYHCDSGGLYLPSNVTLVGDGPSSTLSFRVTGSSIANYYLGSLPVSGGSSGVSRVRVSRICVEGRGTGNRGCFDGSITFNGGSSITVDNVEVRGSSTIGIYFVTCSGCIVSDCMVHDTGADGIGFTLGSTFCRAIGNEVFGTGDDGISATTTEATLGQPTSDVIIEGNTIHDLNMTGTGNGIGICGRRISAVHNCILRAAVCGIRCYEYEIDGTNYVSNGIRLIGNLIDSVGRGSPQSGENLALSSGVYFGGVRDVVILGNNIRDNGAGTYGGIALFNFAKNVLIQGNTIQNVSADGVLIYQHTPAVPVHGVLAGVYDPAFGEQPLDSVGMNGIIVRDNQISGCGSCGVRVLGEASQRANGIFVSGNISYGNNLGGQSACDMLAQWVDNFDGTGNLIGPSAPGKQVATATFFDPSSCSAPGSSGVNDWTGRAWYAT